MKKIALMMMFGVGSLCAQDGAAQSQAAGTKTAATKTTKTTKSTKSAQSTAPAATSTATIASSMPKDAEPVGQGRFRAVDAGGVAWIYQNTPFGVTKIRESELPPKPGQSSGFGVVTKTDEPADKEQSPATLHNVKAFPSGDEIRFEKQTPFGTTAWTKKRTDQLNDIEKDALANAEKTTAASGKN
jgi:hypothetical protein